MPQVLVIGAGPAGSVASILLAAAGINVTLVEQTRFPRDKVCGECVSALGIDVLDRLGLLQQLCPTPIRYRGCHSERSAESRPPADVHPSHHLTREILLRSAQDDKGAEDDPVARPAILTRAVFIAADGSSATIPLSRPMLGISRCRLDAILLDAAINSGADVFQPARCEQVQSGERPAARIRLLDSNRHIAMEPDWIILADGKSALPGAAPPPTRDMGLKAHFVNVDAPADAIQLFGVAGHYGGVAPIEAGRFNVAFSVPRSRISASRGDLDTCFHQIVAENAALQRQMSRSNRVSDWLVSPLPRFGVRNNWPLRVIPIGNAAAAIEPIGGEGMGLAMRSAELAAERLIDAICNGVELDVASLQARFRTLWTARRLACRAAALVVSSPAIANRIVPFIHPDDPLTTFALRAIGKQ